MARVEGSVDARPVGQTGGAAGGPVVHAAGRPPIRRAIDADKHAPRADLPGDGLNARRSRQLRRAAFTTEGRAMVRIRFAAVRGRAHRAPSSPMVPGYPGQGPWPRGSTNPRAGVWQLAHGAEVPTGPRPQGPADLAVC